MFQICTAAETVKIILEAIIGALKLKSGDGVVVFVNNLGGTSQLEQWLVTGEVHKQLSKNL
jgi:dihydroxyacetone kinase